MSKLQFSWAESYAVFGWKDLHDGIPVHTETQVQDIRFNQTCTLASDCEMEPATGVEKPTGHFAVNNECNANLHLGVKQAFSYADKKSNIFFTDEIKEGTVDLAPRVRVLLFFHQHLETGMILKHPVSGAIEIDYAKGVTSHAVKYNNGGQWEVQDGYSPRLAYCPGQGFYANEERI